MKKNVISTGKDFTYMFSIFKELLSKSGIKERDNLIFAGCPGPCYSMATFFSFGIRDLNLNLYFAVDSDIHRLWRLDYVENLGVVAAGKQDPLKARVIVLMSGLCSIPIERTLEFVKDALASGGKIIGETPAHGLFEDQGWDNKIPFDFLFEFSMTDITSFEINPMA
ncbi:MAG: DUF2124 family protein [Desulfatiglandales bacterium]